MTERTTMEPMTETEIQSLKAKAEQATPGPWCWELTGEKSNDWAVGVASTDDGTPIAGRLTTTNDPECPNRDGVFMEDTVLRHTFMGEGDRVADAAYIAACSPDAILRLLALVEQPTILDRAIAAVEAEHLEDPTDSDGDKAYDLAVDHCVRALRALQPPKE